ncbi:unnamed protein product [Cylicocyclus nassatus]|uniref:C-type lectin domain-containing protein n=1 Tax=Cylicocyclus nassatus TaxID=53992 RepID=A0AA36M6T0_CYLNA|nr:unnamed protein product [Cylicocyclus nassatus]
MTNAKTLSYVHGHNSVIFLQACVQNTRKARTPQFAQESNRCITIKQHTNYKASAQDRLMKILIVALFSLTEAFRHPNNNKLIFRNADQSHTTDLDRSNAGCRDHCEVGWTYFDETDACYKNFFRATFQTAENLCKTLGGHLTSIHSYNENLFVAELAKSGRKITDTFTQGTWIGLERYDHLNWTWTDGTKVDFLIWAPGQPDNFRGVQKCGQVWPDPDVDESKALTYQRWDDLHCYIENRSFVCKKKPLH